MKAINGKIFLILISLFTLTSCNKLENKMKTKLFPERPYEKANIDKFYWVSSGWDYTTIPLIKPYNLQKLQGQSNWILETHMKSPKIEKFHGRDTALLSFSPLELFNIYIYMVIKEKK